MRIVEFVGPPNVGKSTLYLKVARQHTRRCPWTTERDVLSRLAPRSNQLRDRLKWLVNRLIRRRQGQLFEPARDAFIADNSDLIDLCWSLVDGHRGHKSHPVDTRFAAAAYYWDCYGRVANIRAIHDDRIVLVDEGLLQRLLSLWSPVIGRDELDAYIELTPQPAGVVVCMTDKDLILSRARKRSRVARKFVGMDDATMLQFTVGLIEMSNSLIDVLRSHNIPVCVIDTSRSPLENAKAVISFIKSICANR